MTNLTLDFAQAVPDPIKMSGDARSIAQRWYVAMTDRASNSLPRQVILKISAEQLGKYREAGFLETLRVRQISRPTFSEEEWKALTSTFGKQAVATAKFLEQEQFPSGIMTAVVQFATGILIVASVIAWNLFGPINSMRRIHGNQVRRS